MAITSSAVRAAVNRLVSAVMETLRSEAAHNSERLEGRSLAEVSADVKTSVLQGGEFTGPISVISLQRKVLLEPAAAGPYELDFDLANVYDLTVLADTTLTVKNVDPDLGQRSEVFVVSRTVSTPHTLTFWPGIRWLTVNGQAPADQPADSIAEYHLTTDDGVNWLGRVTPTY